MSLSFTGVVAMASDRAIGIRQSIPWRLPEDMKLFKRLTMGHSILMGRKTWESLGRPLPGRRNIVLTRDASFVPAGAEVVHSLEELEQMDLEDAEVMVIGGAQIYDLLLPSMKRLYVSRVRGEYEADTWFPAFEHLFAHCTMIESFEGFDLFLYEK